jgi:zinc transporter ZupT
MHSVNMFNYFLPFLGALLGMGIAYVVKPKAPKGFGLVLSFSGAFLLGISIFHLLPAVFGVAGFKPGIWIVAGLILQIVLEFLSQGAEHGHTHSHSNTKLPWILFLSLCLHAFIEGIPMNEQKALVWGLFIHKIPIGIVLFLLIWRLRIALLAKIACLIFFALMSPAGSFTLASISSLAVWKTSLTAVVIGMLLHIATTILFESNQGHAFNIRKLGIIIFGFGLSYLL